MKTKLNCLKCNSEFLSENKKTNRLCESCNKINKHIAYDAYISGISSGRKRSKKS